MKKLFTAIVLSTFAVVAIAATLTGTWTLPTLNTDGSSIPATGAGALVGSTMEYGPCNAARDALVSVTGTVNVTGSVATAVIPNLGPGTWCAHVRVSNTYGEASDWSNVGFKVIDAPKPNAPTNFTLG